MTTSKLVRHAQAGDRPSREALARLWLTRVYGAALARVGNAADADDITQDVFVRAFAALNRLRNPDRFGPWLLRIVRNAATDHYRRKKPAARLPDQDGLPDAALAEGPHERRSDGDALRAWRGLDDEQRLVCWLKIMDGLRFRDIAELTGSSKSAVYRTYQAGVARMRKEVSRC